MKRGVVVVVKGCSVGERRVRAGRKTLKYRMGGFQERERRRCGLYNATNKRVKS